jgi:hypothetical protein
MSIVLCCSAAGAHSNMHPHDQLNWQYQCEQSIEFRINTLSFCLKTTQMESARVLSNGYIDWKSGKSMDVNTFLPEYYEGMSTQAFLNLPKFWALNDDSGIDYAQTYMTQILQDKTYLDLINPQSRAYSENERFYIYWMQGKETSYLFLVPKEKVNATEITQIRFNQFSRNEIKQIIMSIQ